MYMHVYIYKIILYIYTYTYTVDFVYTTSNQLCLQFNDQWNELYMPLWCGPRYVLALEPKVNDRCHRMMQLGAPKWQDMAGIPSIVIKHGCDINDYQWARWASNGNICNSGLFSVAMFDQRLCWSLGVAELNEDPKGGAKRVCWDGFNKLFQCSALSISTRPRSVTPQKAGEDSPMLVLFADW